MRAETRRFGFGRRMAFSFGSEGMKLVRDDFVDRVIAVGIEAGHFGDGLDAARRAAAADEDDQIDRFGDQPARHRDDAFLDQLLEPVERRPRGIGMDGGDAAGMAGVPGLQHVEGFGAADLADDDAVGPKPQRRAHQIGHGDDAGFGAQRHAIGRRALQLARILDQDHPLIELGDLGEERIGERGLAGARAAGDQEIARAR